MATWPSPILRRNVHALLQASYALPAWCVSHVAHFSLAFAANVVSMDEQVKNSLQSRSSAIHPATNSKAPTHAASMPTLVSLFRDTTQPWPCATPSEYQYLSGCWMHSTTKPSCTVLRSSLLFSHANACVGLPAVGHLFTKSLNATVSLAEKP